MADQPERDFVAASTHGRLNGIPDEIAERDAPAWRASMLMQQHYLTGELDADRNDHCVCGRWASGEMSPGWDDHLAEELAEAGLLAAPAAAPVPQPPTLAETRTGKDWCPSCRVEVGTDRYTATPTEHGQAIGAPESWEACATCGSALAAVPQGTEDALVKSAAENLNPASEDAREPEFARLPQWQVTVSVPADLPADQRMALASRVADVAHDWEPEDRDGWDVDVSAGPALAVPAAQVDRDRLTSAVADVIADAVLREEWLRSGDVADAVSRVPHPDTAEAARLRQEQEAHRITLADAMGAGHDKTMAQLVEWATDLYREWGKVIAERDQAVAALESAQRQMTRFEVQRDKWKAALGVYQGDIDTTPEQAVAALRASWVGTDTGEGGSDA